LDKIDQITDRTQQNYHGSFPPEEKLQEVLSDVFVYNQPIGKVGGDGYWLYEKDQYIYLAIFDCIGQGHLASMMSRIYAKALKKLVVDYRIEFPGSILQFIHREIQARFKDKKHAIMNTGADLGIVKIDRKENILDFAGARMDLLRVIDGKIEVVKGDELQIGELFDHKHEYHTVKIDTSVPSNFYLMSDGLKLLKGGVGHKPLGEERIIEHLIQNREQSMGNQKKAIIDMVNNWRGSFEQSDDILMIGFEM
jgi:serine phosphatase RsbU (regulator of sigma subunit)